MLYAAQEQSLRVNLIKHHIESQYTSPMCSLCGELSETVTQISGGFPLLAQPKYQILSDIVGKPINWLLLKKYGIPSRNKWSAMYLML